MSLATKPGVDPAAAATMHALETLIGPKAIARVGFRFWDGECWPDPSPRAATIVLQHPGALRAILSTGNDVGLGEAYLYNDFDIEGDAEAVFDLADMLSRSQPGWLDKLRAANDLLHLPTKTNPRKGRRGPAKLSGMPHSIERDRQAVTFHYNVSNDFYALWLDRHMVYSCAYFDSPDEDLDTAQELKLDYLCRKLRLQPGQHLLDLGCGWGGLVMHAAKHYGVNAKGITLSEPQAALANDRIVAAGLQDRCRVEVRDYRQIDEPEGYDALVSVGMFEHVGAAMLPSYFERAYRLLKPGGAFMNHGIAATVSDQVQKGPSFVDSYVFPDGELVPINVTLRAAEGARFEVRDVESLREHYALTLRHWVRRLEARHQDTLLFVDEPTYRVWRLYMSGSAHGFARGQINVYQTLLVKQDVGGESHLPLTRRNWYAS